MTSTKFELQIHTATHPWTGNIKNAVRQYGTVFHNDAAAVTAAKLLSKVEGITEVVMTRWFGKQESRWQNGEVV